ncbi:MAG: hypothetical protein WAO20_17280 [Acidobacteriota bacterium]
MGGRIPRPGAGAGLFLIACTGLFGLSGLVAGQSADDLSQSLEGRAVTVRIDMPATKDGIDFYPEREQPIDFSEYGKRLKDSGVALRPGDRVLITKIKAKERHIEVQLGGGGYGTAGDESAWVETPTVPKGEREKELEKLLKKEEDPAKRRALERERSGLADQRRREERLMKAMAERVRAEKEARVRELRLEAGSRFNVRYDRELTAQELTPQNLEAVLARFLDFSAPADPDDGESAAGGFSLRKGLLWEDVIGYFGDPAEVRERSEGNLRVTSCSYDQGDEVIRLEFVEGVLIRYSAESK